MIKEITCISCPLGCRLTVTIEDDKIISVTGNSCKRGISYAESEINNPRRMLTTTVKVKGGIGPLVAVKSAEPLPKDKLFDCMRVINDITIEAPVKTGAPVLKDILGLGIDIIATSENERLAEEN